MMRYQGLSPDNLPLSNGKRSHWRSCKEDDGIIGHDENDGATKTIPNFVEAHKRLPKIRSSGPKPTQDQNFSTFSTTTPNSLPKTNHDLNNSTTSPLSGSGGSGDMLLQWGHRKRSRISRSVENRAAGAGSGMVDDSSSSSSTQLQAMMKVPRRSITLPTPASAIPIETKNSSHTNIMPPPSSIFPNTISTTSSAVNNSSTFNGKVGNHKSSSKDNSSFVNRRSLEDRSVGGSGSHPSRNISSSKGVIAAAAAGSSSRSKVLKRSPQKVVEKNDHVKIVSHATTTAVCSSGLASSSDEKMNGLVHQEQVKGIGMNHQENHIGSGLPQEAGCSNTTCTTTNNNNHGNAKIVAAAAATVNGGGEVFEWPRVLIPLTRKEKEEDFLLMKGTKLPHRPKKRPKAVDRMLQYCFPGTWLADVTKARYEVKEKKGTTKKPKRRGLKGMESMESDSE